MCVKHGCVYAKLRSAHNWQLLCQFVKGIYVRTVTTYVRVGEMRTNSPSPSPALAVEAVAASAAPNLMRVKASSSSS